jgi:hypothetical protein
MAKDLHNRRLIGTDNFHAMLSASGALERRATGLGKQFLAFITNPGSIG